LRTAMIVMWVIAAALFVVAYSRGDGSHVTGLKISGGMLLEIIPVLLAAFLVAGFAQALVPRQVVTAWLGQESGIRGILIASVAGAMTPGGPYVSFPIVAGLYKAGAGIGTVVAFVTAWSLWAFSRVPLELAYLGPKPAIARFVSTLVFPPIAGLLAHALFSRWA